MIEYSACVMDGVGDATRATNYYLRAVVVGWKILSREGGRDAWAAFREYTEWVDIIRPGASYLEHTERTVVECVSDAPRDTIEGAVEDMHAALRRHLDPYRRPRARLSYGPVNLDITPLIGPDPLGDS